MRYLSLVCLFIFLLGCGSASNSVKNELGETISLPEIEQLIAKKLLGQAQLKLNSFLQQKPEDINANLLMARLLYEQKNFSGALVYLTKVIEMGNKKATVYQQMGNNYYQLNNYYLALQSYKQAIALDPLLTEAYLKIGDIYLEWQNFPMASQWYDKAVKTDEKSADVTYTLAKLNLEMGKTEQSFKLLQSTFEINPLHLDGRTLELNLLSQTSKTKELLERTKAFIKDFPHDSEGYLFLGKFYLNLKNYQTAKEYYELAMKKAPQLASSFNGMGNYYFETNDFSNATKYYKKATELNPNYSHVFYNLGLVYWKQNKYQDAIIHFTRSYDLNKWFKEALFFISMCHDKLGDKEQSLRFLTAFYDKDANIFYNDYLVHSTYGPVIARILQNFWDFYDKANAYHRGYFVSLVDSKSKALQLLSRENGNSDAYFHLSRLHLLLGEKEKAKEFFLRYLKSGKPDMQTLLLDTSYNAFKGEDWFFKALDGE